MVYVLGKNFLDITAEYEISDSYYELLSKSKRTLSEVLRVEESYEVLICLYKDLEKLILEISVEHLATSGMGYDRIFESLVRVNIKLLGFLSGARLYIDQLKSRAGRVGHSVDYKSKVERALSEKYDSSVEYRFIEALRNYSAHRGLPVHSITFGGGWDSNDMEVAHNRYNISIYSSKNNFLKDRMYFKSMILSEMEEKIDLIKYIRIYLEHISSVHVEFRGLVEKDVVSSRVIIETAVSQYCEIFDEKPFGLGAYKKDERGLSDEVPLLLEWDDVRIGLQRKNRSLAKLSRRYVSNKLT